MGDVDALRSLRRRGLSPAAAPLAMLVMLASVMLAVACDVAAPRAPFGVPKHAAWANGHWVDCWRDDKDEHVFTCDIYTRDAKIDAKGTFLLVDGATGQKSVAPREPLRFTSWGDGALHLAGGRKLIRKL